MPELAAFYFAGLLASLMLGALFGWKQRSKYHSKEYATIQNNLLKINRRWNDLNLSVEEITSDGQHNSEYQKARMTSMAVIFGGMILSWLGFLFLIVIWLSLTLVGKTRTEKFLYTSQLAKRELSVEEINAELKLILNVSN